MVCATSHYYAKHSSIPAFCERRAEAMERLSSVLTEDLPQVLPAAEVAYFPRMEEQDLTPLCIQGTRTLMLEMPFADWTSLQLETWKPWCWIAAMMWCWCTLSGSASANPTSTNWKNWQNCPSGCRSTRAVCFVEGTRRLALDLLQMAQYPLLGSDCHNLTSRPPNLKKEEKVVMQKLGEAFLKKIDWYGEWITTPAAEVK